MKYPGQPTKKTQKKVFIVTQKQKPLKNFVILLKKENVL